MPRVRTHRSSEVNRNEKFLLALISFHWSGIHSRSPGLSEIGAQLPASTPGRKQANIVIQMLHIDPLWPLRNTGAVRRRLLTASHKSCRCPKSHKMTAVNTSLHLKTIRLLDKMQKLLLTCHRGFQRRLYPQRRNRKLQGSKQLHCPLPVKGLPPNPEKDMAESHIKSSGANADSPQSQHALRLAGSVSNIIKRYVPSYLHVRYHLPLCHKHCQSPSSL